MLLVVNMKPKHAGLAGFFGLLLFYSIVLTLSNSVEHALQQFKEFWYFIVALALGFGIQLHLYAQLKQLSHSPSLDVEVGVTGGVSATSMVACCLHHITEVLPIIGLSALSAVLAQYQTPLLVASIIINIIGITILMEKLQKMPGLSKTLHRVVAYDWKAIKHLSLVAGVVIIGVMLTTNAEVAGAELESIELEPRTNTEGGVSIHVTPQPFRFGEEVKFDIAINTHSGSLDFDLEKISILVDEEGNTYRPLRWQGSEPGGHHRTGTLVFEGINNTTTLKLVMFNIYGVEKRVFEWKLNVV